MTDNDSKGNQAPQEGDDREPTLPTAFPSSPQQPPKIPHDTAAPGGDSATTPATNRTMPTALPSDSMDTNADISQQGYPAGTILLERYRVDGVLGKGGMGIVYRCMDLVGDVRVAIKTIPPAISWNAQEMEEIRDNFRLVERLHHPHIANAKTIERDPENGQYFLVMELAEGVNLRQHRKRVGGTLPWEEIIQLGRQLASALDYGHSEMIIHRDIKPSNIMITEAGKIKLLDYGIASQYHESMSRLTNAKYETSGTGPYMAPEQWRGDFQDAKTDQYALAVVLYELFAGKPPFYHADLMILGRAVQNELPPKPDGISDKTWSAFQKALSKDRKDRFKSCAEFIDAIEESSSAQPLWQSRHIARYGLGGLMILVLLLLGLRHCTSDRIQPPPPEPPPIVQPPPPADPDIGLTVPSGSDNDSGEDLEEDEQEPGNDHESDEEEETEQQPHAPDLHDQDSDTEEEDDDRNSDDSTEDDESQDHGELGNDLKRDVEEDKEPPVIPTRPVQGSRLVVAEAALAPDAQLPDGIATIPDFSRELNDHLTDQDIFQMLERDALHDWISHLRQGGNRDVLRTDERMLTLEADFVVLPVIQSLSFSQTEREIPFTSETRTMLTGEAKISLRIVNARSHESIRIPPITYSKTNPNYRGHASGFIRELFREAASVASTQIIQELGVEEGNAVEEPQKENPL